MKNGSLEEVIKIAEQWSYDMKLYISLNSISILDRFYTLVKNNIAQV